MLISTSQNKRDRKGETGNRKGDHQHRFWWRYRCEGLRRDRYSPSNLCRQQLFFLPAGKPTLTLAAPHPPCSTPLSSYKDISETFGVKVSALESHSRITRVPVGFETSSITKCAHEKQHHQGSGQVTENRDAGRKNLVRLKAKKG